MQLTKVSSSPWGRIQHASPIIDGLMMVHTAGHGGIKVERALNARIPDYMRRAGGWYEEDAEWSIPFVVFAKEITAGGDEYSVKAINEGSHLSTLRSWFPDEYERFTGLAIQPGESYIRDERVWKAEHAKDIQVLAAWGSSWQAGVPEGYVGVCACVGGRGEGHLGFPEKYYLVPDAEYQARCRHGFIVDPARHIEVEDFTGLARTSKAVTL